MENDPLQQLRDVHFPADPSWWPPALGWWLLALMLLAAITYGAVRALRWHQARAPLRQARQLLTHAETAVRAGHISPLDYVDECNELLKRLLVRALGRTRFAELSGEAWLIALDKLSDTDAFTNGPGRALGNERYRPEPQLDTEALAATVDLALQGAYR